MEFWLQWTKNNKLLLITYEIVSNLRYSIFIIEPNKLHVFFLQVFILGLNYIFTLVLRMSLLGCDGYNYNDGQAKCYFNYDQINRLSQKGGYFFHTIDSIFPYLTPHKLCQVNDSYLHLRTHQKFKWKIFSMITKICNELLMMIKL